MSKKEESDIYLKIATVAFILAAIYFGIVEEVTESTKPLVFISTFCGLFGAVCLISTSSIFNKDLNKDKLMNDKEEDYNKTGVKVVLAIIAMMALMMFVFALHDTDIKSNMLLVIYGSVFVIVGCTGVFLDIHLEDKFKNKPNTEFNVEEQILKNTNLILRNIASIDIPIQSIYNYSKNTDKKCENITDISSKLANLNESISNGKAESELGDGLESKINSRISSYTLSRVIYLLKDDKLRKKWKVGSVTEIVLEELNSVINHLHGSRPPYNHLSTDILEYLYKNSVSLNNDSNGHLYVLSGYGQYTFVVFHGGKGLFTNKYSIYTSSTDIKPGKTVFTKHKTEDIVNEFISQEDMLIESYRQYVLERTVRWIIGMD